MGNIPNDFHQQNEKMHPHEYFLPTNTFQHNHNLHEQTMKPWLIHEYILLLFV